MVPNPLAAAHLVPGRKIFILSILLLFILLLFILLLFIYYYYYCFIKDRSVKILSDIFRSLVLKRLGTTDLRYARIGRLRMRLLLNPMSLVVSVYVIKAL